MSAPMQPAALVRHSQRLLLDKDVPAWIELWDDDGVAEFPFAPEGWPKRLEGKAAVADYMSGYFDHIDIEAFPRLEIHQTTDPATVVVEMRATGRLVQTDAPYEMDYITVVTVAEGSITRFRDYWNPLVLTESGGAADFAGSER